MQVIDINSFEHRKDDRDWHIFLNKRVMLPEKYTLPNGVYTCNKMPERFSYPRDMRKAVLYIPSFYYKDLMDIVVCIRMDTRDNSFTMACLGVMKDRKDHISGNWTTGDDICKLTVEEFERYVIESMNQLVYKYENNNKTK